MIREIVEIDEELCDGCGQCVPACHEGAIQIVDGKARLIADNICDGLGACLGHCPQGAIRILQREAEAFDEAAVEAHLEHSGAAGTPAERPAVTLPTVASQTPSPAGGCPGSRVHRFTPPRDTPAAAEGAGQPSQLGHWPVKLRLLPVDAPVLRGARLLVAADCAPFAMADFHARLLAGHAVVIGCPKFDDLQGYVDKLTEIIRRNELEEITVAHMEVPCCTGLLNAVHEARRRAGIDVAIHDVVVGTQGAQL